MATTEALGFLRGSNKGSARCEPRAKMEVGCGMTEILMAACERKPLPQEWDLLSLTDRMWGSYKKTPRKSHVTIAAAVRGELQL